jgi:hypothetical protein
MNDERTKVRYKNFLIDVKPLSLRDSNEWTTHFALYQDHGNKMEPIANVHMGNRCKNEEEATKAGIREAMLLADQQ